MKSDKKENLKQNLWELAFGPKTDSLVCEFWIPPPDVIWQPMFFPTHRKLNEIVSIDSDGEKYFRRKEAIMIQMTMKKMKFKNLLKCLKYLLTLFLLLPLCCCLPPAPPGIWGKGFFWDCPLKLNLEDVPSNQELSEPYSWKDLSCGRKSLY